MLFVSAKSSGKGQYAVKQHFFFPLTMCSCSILMPKLTSKFVVSKHLVVAYGGADLNGRNLAVNSNFYNFACHPVILLNLKGCISPLKLLSASRKGKRFLTSEGRLFKEGNDFLPQREGYSRRTTQ